MKLRHRRRQRMKLRHRIVLRLLGIKVSTDGTRWLAPRKHRAVMDRSFDRIRRELWVEGYDAQVHHSPEGLKLTGAREDLEVRWT